MSIFAQPFHYVVRKWDETNYSMLSTDQPRTACRCPRASRPSAPSSGPAWTPQSAAPPTTSSSSAASSSMLWHNSCRDEAVNGGVMGFDDSSLLNDKLWLVRSKSWLLHFSWDKRPRLGCMNPASCYIWLLRWTHATKHSSFIPCYYSDNSNRQISLSKCMSAHSLIWFMYITIPFTNAGKEEEEEKEKMNEFLRLPQKDFLWFLKEKLQTTDSVLREWKIRRMPCERTVCVLHNQDAQEQCNDSIRWNSIYVLFITYNCQ